MIKIFITLIFIMLSCVVSATSACFNLYNELLPDNYYGIPTNSQYSSKRAKILEKNISNSNRKTALVNENGDLFNKYHYQQYYITGDEGEARIKVFGPSRKKNGEDVIDFKIDVAPNSKEISSEDSTLRTMSLRQMYNAGYDLFSAYRLKKGAYILMPSQEKNKRGSTIFSAQKVIGSINNKTKLQGFNGEITLVDNYLIFKNNFYITTEESSLINGYFKQGGVGDILYYNVSDRSSHRYKGLLLRIEDISEITDIEGLFFNSESFHEIGKIISKGYRTYLTTTEHGIGAAHLTGVHKENIRKERNAMALYFKNRDSTYSGETGLFIFTKNSSPDVVVHEFRHEEDGVLKLLDKLKNEFKAMELYFSNTEFRTIQSFIYEQRAYSTQLNYIRNLDAKGKTFRYRVRGKEFTSEFDEYLAHMTVSLTNQFERLYLDKTVELLKRYKASISPQKYEKLLLIIKDQFIKNEHIDLSSPNLSF